MDLNQCDAVRSGRSSSNLSVYGFGFLERGDSREAHSRLLMRPDETFSHIPGQSPGLQLATLLPAVQINKANPRGPPEPGRAMPSQAGTNHPPLTVLKYRLSIFNSRNKKLFQCVTNKVVPHVVAQAVVVAVDAQTPPNCHWNLCVFLKDVTRFASKS